MSDVDPRGPVEPLQPDRSLSELISTLTEDLTSLVRKEIELGREEVRVEAKRAANVGKLFGIAAVAGYLALIMAVFAAAWGLTELVPEGVAFLIVAIVLAAVAAVFALRGRTQVQQLDPKPQQTIDTIKEDAQWLSERRS